MLDGWTHSEAIEIARLGWEVLAGIGVFVVGAMNRRLREALKVMATKADLTDHKEAHQKEHKELEERLASGDVRFATIETTLKHMPTKDDIDSLILMLGNMSASMEGIKSDIKHLNVQVRQLVQNELEHRT